MSLTAMCLLESASRIFLMNSTYIMSRKKDSNVFALRRPNVSHSHQVARISEKNIFHELDVHHV